MTRSHDSTRYRRDTLENLDGLAQIAQFGVSPAVQGPRVLATYSQAMVGVGPKHPRSSVDSTPSRARKIRRRGNVARTGGTCATNQMGILKTLLVPPSMTDARTQPSRGIDLRKAFWPYWLHALTRHRWRRRRGAGVTWTWPSARVPSPWTSRTTTGSEAYAAMRREKRVD